MNPAKRLDCVETGGPEEHSNTPTHPAFGQDSQGTENPQGHRPPGSTEDKTIQQLMGKASLPCALLNFFFLSVFQNIQNKQL